MNNCGKRNCLCYLLPVALLFFISSGCTNNKNDDQNGSDPCSNGTGNGNEIITGPAGPEINDYDQVFRSLEVDPSNPDIVYIGTERNGIVKTTDGGITWHRLRQGIRHSASGYPEVWDIAVSSSNPQFVIAATADSPGPVSDDYPSSMAGIYISGDAGSTWSRSDCGLSNSYALSVQFGSDDPETIVLGIGAGKATFSALLGQSFDGILLRSNDDGMHWIASSVPAGADKNVYWIICPYKSETNGFITFGLNLGDSSKNLGFLRSEDDGLHWNPFASSLRTRLITAFDVSSDGRIIYAVERDAFTVLKSSDSGLTWDTLKVPANGPIKLSPSDPDIVIFCEGEKVYRSANGLQTQNLMLSSMDRVDDIEFSQSNTNMVYLASKGYHIYKSTDGGLTWSYLISLRSAGILN